MEAGLCEEQLNQADALLQSDIRLLAAGKGPQRAGEVEWDLDKADGMIRLLFNDVQALKDGRHPQGEQMYRRVYRLHERLVAIRTEYNLRLKAGVPAPVTQVTQVTVQTSRRPELEDSSLRYLQDLLAWVEDNQRRVDSAEWGVDLPSVEAQLGSHRGLHQSIEEFRAKIERARTDEGQLSPAIRGAYRDCLGRLDLQYAKLLNSSKGRLRSLESLHGFVAAATKELMWLSEKEEEEVGFDWSERNSNMAAKKESYSALMRELELKEKKIKEIQNTGDRLLREEHPARATVESFQAALQTQWSWMLQLCCCVEAHLKENTAYFQFFSDVREAEERLRKLQETLRRKYTCDRSITVTRLEDLLQDAQDEKEQLNEYRGHLSGLAKRAKAIVQLKPRNPAHPVRGRVPLLAVCDYKQVEVTVHKGDECQLVGPVQPFHWKVVSSGGSEAAVPSVCFLVPPPNQEAQEAVTRLEAQHQALVTLWHQLHVDLKSLLAWQSLSRDLQLIRSWTLVTFRTLKPEEQRQALRNLELHYQAFLRDSQDASSFGPEDRLQAEREYSACSHQYQQLLQSLEQGEQEESRCQRCISELKDIRLQLEACETRTVHRLRLPLDKEPARECAQRIAEQQKAQAEVEGLGKGVARLSEEAEKVLALPEPSPAAPVLRSELELTLGKLEQVRSLSAIYLEKLKTISLVIRSTQEAEEVLRVHEEQLKEAQAVPATLPELEATKAALKKLRAQAEAQQPVFDALRDELRGAQEVGQRLQQRHGERDVEVERWRERVAQLLERWQAVLAQADARQRELDQLGRQLRYYRESADPLDAWLRDAKQRQEQIQAVPLAHSRAVREQLRQEKALLEEIERHEEKVEECQRFARQYINAIKDYELQLVTYKAQLEPVASPAKKPKVQSGSESVIQEYVDLRTRYSELTTLTSQYIRFISETLRRMEEEEMQTVQQEQLLQETQALQQTFLSEKDSLLQRERLIEQEKAKLERLFQDEVAKAKQLREEQQRQQQQMEQEKQQLVASMEEARRRQREAEEGVRRKQEELQRLEQQRQAQEKLLAEENQRLRERLQQLEEEHRAALAHSEEIAVSQATATRALPNGRDAPDGPAPEVEPEYAFDGLRQKVPAQRLQDVGVLSAEELQRLAQGRTTVAELAQREDVRRYLQGCSSIAGLLLKPANEKLSVYAAMKRQLLSPGTAIILLEAQAASGFLLDPVRNRRLTVNEAVKEGLVGPELHHKLLSAERAVTGYKDPYTGESISLFQAMQKDLIVRDHGIRLLEAQIATGGIIDPVHSHRLPVHVAYQRGYFDEEMNRVLADPSDDTKGFFDPNTHENLTYLQLLERCVEDPETGLRLLPLTDQAARGGELVYTDSEARDVFEKATVSAPFGKFQGRTVTIWEIINSEYFTAEQRRDLLRQFRTGKVTVEKIIKILVTIVEEVETTRQQRLSFSGLRAPVPASELLASGVLNKAQFEQLKDGKTSVKDLSEMESVRTLLRGSGCLAGVYLEDSKEKVSIYEAMRRGLLRPSTATLLLEAQAATGFLVDPVRNQRLYVHEAVKAGVVGPELHEKLLSAEKAVTGYKDPYSGSTISLFQAMQKGLVLRDHGIRLLEAQIATGGIIDPVHSHRLPVHVAYQRGYFDEEMNRVLADPSDDTKGFFDPNTHENLTYLQLLERCVEDPETGLRLLPLKGAEKAEVVETTQVYTEEETRRAFEETQIDIPSGGSQGSSTMSLWEVMQSDLIPKEQRAQLMADFQAGRVTKERMIIIIIEIIEKTEIIRQQNLASYDYVRRRLTAEDLYEAKIISREIYSLLREGTKTLREVLEAESARRYLYGTGCVAGVYVPGSQQTLTIYQALKKGLLSAEVARSLLEAQAATGFLLDPVKGERLTVDEAVRKGLVGPELHDRLLSAERAVTGYRDPYTEQTISLFQAMKKDLIPAEEALRLLDAQLATGGIVDPRLGFHLPLEVAYQRGYLNKDTHDQLSEPSEVRSYVDPSTDERLSYTQLLRRCRRDEHSGQLLLPLSDTRKLTFRGLRKQITVEELVRSQVLDEAIARRLQEGLTSVEEVTKDLQKFLEGTSCIAGVFVDATKERLSVYQAMKKGIIRPGTAFELLEAQAATGYVIDPIKGLKLTVEEAVRMGIVGPEFKDKLLSAERAVTGYKDPYSGKLISLFQAMKKGLILKDHGIRLLEAQIATGGIIDPEESHRLPVEVAYKRGLFDEEMNLILEDPSDDTKGFFDPNTEENLTYLQLMERCITDPQTGLCLLPLKEKKRERKTSSKSSVRKRRVVIVDPETGKEMSVYEAYRKGLIDHQTYLELSEQECEWEEITISSSDGVVKSMIIDRRSGRQYDIDEAITKNLIDRSVLDQYRAGTLSITEFADMLSGNASGFRSRSSSVGSSSSYPISPAVSRTQLASWSDPTEETGPVAGILDTETLEKVSITEAMHRNLVDNITGQRLLEAQACTGGIIDPGTGARLPVPDAVEKGLVDKIMVDRINLAQKAFSGFEDPRTKTKMSAAQALKKGWLYYEAGQRFLEVQYLTGGLIEPDAPGRVPLDEALQRGTVDARTAQKLRDVSAYSKYLTCPKTKLKISYKDALDRSMVEEGTGLRLLEASAQSSKGYYSPYSISGSGSTAGSRTGSRTGSRAGSRRGSFDATGSSFSMTFSSSSYSSSGYGRRYTSGPPTSPGGPESAKA
ncbi:plectin [Phyllostomus discolor]|uniref:Plectin n=1 Tax=Phyllostomus discolor TaxID=89673 RepID=A0A834E430_9CHIR|nr:plectin [Phyllostomus discolor]